MNKKAQAQIITTVLIILLVLAAVVIVWQVVNTTVSKGAQELESQSACLGVVMEVTAVEGSTTQVDVKRAAGGKTLTNTDVIYIEDGASTTYPGVLKFSDSLESERITVPAGATVEIALKLSDGTVCPMSGKATAGTG